MSREKGSPSKNEKTRKRQLKKRAKAFQVEVALLNKSFIEDTSIIPAILESMSEKIDKQIIAELVASSNENSDSESEPTQEPQVHEIVE